MAITVAGSDSGGGSAATPTIPGTPAENDLIVVVTATIGANTYDVTTAGYTTAGTIDANNQKTRIFAKRMGASPDASVAIGTGSGAWAIYNLRGVDTTTFEDAVAVMSDNTVGGLGGGYTSEAITTVTANAWVLTVINAEATTVDPSGAPTGYNNFKLGNFSSPNIVCVAAGWKEIAVAGAENPGIFPDTATPDGGAVAGTWAVRPAVAAGGGGAINMLLLGVG